MVFQDYIPQELRELYEIHDYKHAAAILAKEFPAEYEEIRVALMEFRFKRSDIIEGGGNESLIPKRFSSLLKPKGWREAKLEAKMVVNDEEIRVESHKIDYCKGRVAVDLEWNSKDQTFDRDLYAFRTFFDYDKISVGVLVTRSIELNDIFKHLEIMQKYGASTTQMGKLLPRLHSGRNGGCPILVFGITKKLYIDDGQQTS